ncbi:MAG: ferrochelatase [Steroidobacter sp.]
MSDYVGERRYEHGSPDRLGVLVVNLGTPDAPTPAAVRRFLAQFLWDPRVVEAPRWLWWLALHGVILRIRPAKSAHAYRQIWTAAGSPLRLYSQALVTAIRDRLSGHLDAGHPDSVVALGMSYGSPSIPAALEELRRAGAHRLIVLPLYPQYSATTTASAFDSVSSELQRWRWIPELRFITGYHDEPAYIDAISASIDEHRSTQDAALRGSHLLFSFHGLPQRYVMAGDPYQFQSEKTARLIAGRLRLTEEAWSMSFQSQVGREEWLRPYTDEWLIRFARQGGKRVTVVCPGFATDCLETLEEIALRNRATFLANGGEFYDYVPALNASAAHAALLADLIRRHASGWPQTSASADSMASRKGALAAGAEH